MFRTTCLTIIFIVFSITAFSQTLILTDGGKVEVKGRMLHWRDKSGKLSFDEAQRIQLNELDTAKSPNFGFDKAIHWFKLTVKNESSTPDWLLEIAFAPLDKIDFYIQSDSTLAWQHKATGDCFPIASRDLKHRHPIFKFYIEPTKTKTIYLRLDTHSSVQLPTILWHRSAFQDSATITQLVNGLFFGGMILMMLYQFVLYISIRDRVTLYYVLTLFSMIIIVAFFQGYSFLYAYPDSPIWNDILAIFIGPLFIICSTFLTRAFLNLRKFSTLLDKLMFANMTLDVLAGLAMFIFFRKISYQYHHYAVLIHCVLALTSAGYCLHKKYRSARFYLIAWVTVLVATAFFTLSNLGFLPGYLRANYAGLMTGCVLQMLFIAFALGDRWNILRKENQYAKELELKRRNDEKEKLEQEVQLRIEEIHQKSQRLEEVNRVKDKLFSVVSHDIKGPLNSLQLALSLLKTGDVSQEEFRSLSSALEERFSHTTEFIENLLNWASLQLKGQMYEPAMLNIKDVADETINLFTAEINRKNITLVNKLSVGITAYADLNMVRAVFRNLLTNAIKFTKPEGTITVNSRVDGKVVVISVADTGVGIPVAYRNTLFTLSSVTTPGTRQEGGTGLGLMLCKEFIESNGGKIWYESEEQEGTTFFFTLPTAIS